MDAINPVTNMPMSTNMNVSGLGPLGVQVPPNLYQRPPVPPGMTPMRHQVPGPLTRPQMMAQLNPRSPIPPVQRLPKPITPKKPVPRPMMMSRQEWTRTPSPANSPGTPTNAVVRGGVGASLRGRSLATPPQAAWPDVSSEPSTSKLPMTPSQNGSQDSTRTQTLSMQMMAQLNPRSPIPPVQRLPKPITPKKPVPRPMMMSRQEWTRTPSPANSPGTPTNAVVRGGVGASLRGRSLAMPPQAAWPGRGGANWASTIHPSTIFQEPPKAEGTITIGQNELGNRYCYQIVLDDGGIIFLPDVEVTAMKRKYGGVLPRRIAIHPDGSFM